MLSDSDPLAAARRLRAALDHVADALVHARLDGVLEAERPLATAVATWPAGPVAGGPDREPLRQEMVRLRTSLERCRRFGGVLTAFAAASSRASGWARGYDRRGAAQLREVPDVRALEARA
jgi:hypothetical protein